MMNGKDLAIGVLSVTAVVLLTAVLIIHAVAPTPAMAFGQSGRIGPYVAATGQLDEWAELLLLVDSDAGLMNVYGFDANMGGVVLIQQINLLAEPAAPEQQGAQRRR